MKLTAHYVTKRFFSELGKGCKMCGMSLEDESKEFCSKQCRLKYKGINRQNN